MIEESVSKIEDLFDAEMSSLSVEEREGFTEVFAVNSLVVLLDGQDSSWVLANLLNRFIDDKAVKDIFDSLRIDSTDEERRDMVANRIHYKISQVDIHHTGSVTLNAFLRLMSDVHVNQNELKNGFIQFYLRR